MTEEWSADPREWLPNPHAGEMLWLEFMEPVGIRVADLASSLEVDSNVIQAVLDGNRRMDANLDLRLGRYFGMSDGFFLRLQTQYEILEQKRALNGELDRIHPRPREAA